MTVRSDDEMDEFSTSATNRVCILRDDKVLMNTIDPEVVGLHKSSLKDIQISTKEDAIFATINPPAAFSAVVSIIA